jgi:hypothetical protein
MIREWSENDQRMIREWSSDFSGTRKLTLTKLYPEIRHSLINITANFERFDSGLLSYDSVVKISMTKFSLEDLLWMILMPKFWRYVINLLSNRLVRSLKDFLLVMKQYLSIYMCQLASNRFICVGCRIFWQTIYAKNGRSMQALCCHSCMLPNVMAGIILWVMMGPGFLQYITASDVDSVERWCGHKIETWYSEQKHYIYEHMESNRLLCRR